MTTPTQLIGIKVSIASAIAQVDKDNSFSPQRREQMAEALAQFCLKAVDKYYKGHKEHGGELAERDLDAEIEAEILDLFWYSNAKHWKQ